MAAALVCGADAAFAASKGETLVKGLLAEHEYNQPRRIGVIAGARHYCGLEINQFLDRYWTQLDFTMQQPRRVWDRMIDQGDKTENALRQKSVPCDEAFKGYVGRLGY